MLEVLLSWDSSTKNLERSNRWANNNLNKYKYFMTVFHNYVDHLLIFDYSLTAVSLFSCKTSYFPFGITIDQTNNNAHGNGILSLFTLLYFNMQLMCIICIIFFSGKKYKVWQQNCNREKNVCALKFVDILKR